MPLFPNQVTVEIINPETPFGGVLIEVDEQPDVQVELGIGSPVLSVFGRIGNVAAQCSDYASCYAPLGSGIPPGGAMGYVLTKLSGASLDIGWEAAGGFLGNPTALVGLTPVNGVAATGIRSDGAPALDTSIAPTWTGYHVFQIGGDTMVTPTLPNNLVNKAYVDAKIAPTGTQLLTGGGVAWTGTGLNFIISPATYLINGNFYSSPMTPVTLAPADPTNARIDVFYVNSSSTAGDITGTPGGPPLEPQVDPSTQLRLTSVDIPAGSTTPLITNENIYLENTEWSGTTNTGAINLASTNNPYQGTHDIEGTATNSGNNFVYTKPLSATVRLSDYANLVFYIRSKAAWANPKSITIQWINSLGASPVNVGTAVTVKDGTFGFASGSISAYQQIVIPASLFNAGTSLVNRVSYTIAGGGGAIGWYIDNIILQTGSGGGGGGMGTVTTFSAGNLAPLFTTSVTNPSTTPALLFSLSNAGAHQYFGNNTGGSGAPGFHQIDYSELTGTPASLSFIDSLVLSGGNVSLKNDTATPGASQYYGTNAGSVLGYYALPAGVSPAALTANNDTNVTLTLGGTPATALLQAASITAGWTGQLSLSRGGTGVDNTSIAAHNYFGNNAGSSGSAGFHQIGYAELSGTPSFIDSVVLSGGNVSLVNDSAAPGASKYYGTNAGSTLGYFSLPSGTSGSLHNFNFTWTKTSGLSVGQGPGYWTCLFTGTITGWNIAVDAGTITIRIWKIASGTASPTVANNINTSGLSLSSGTAIRSSTVTDFTTLAVTAGDIFAWEITAVSGVNRLGGAVEITQT